MAELMAERQEGGNGRRIQDAAETLGLSPEAVRSLTPDELDLSFAALETPKELRSSSDRSAGDLLIAELHDRISVLERRLDDAEAERRELITAIAAERKRLVQLLLEQQPEGTWPGIWPMLRRLHQRWSRKMP